MSAYDGIKNQITFTTGRQDITCTQCSSQHAVANVSGMKKEQGHYYRDVRTSCRSCRTIIIFRWFRS